MKIYWYSPPISGKCNWYIRKNKRQSASFYGVCIKRCEAESINRHQRENRRHSEWADGRRKPLGNQSRSTEFSPSRCGLRHKSPYSGKVTIYFLTFV